MKPLVRTALLVLTVWLQLTGISFAKQVYLKDGSILECESFWRRNGWVVVKVNRDILLEFTNAEIDLKKTFRKQVAPEQRIKKKKHPAAVSVAPGAKAAESPERAVLATPTPAQTPAAINAKVEPAVAQSNPAPAPAPAKASAPEAAASAAASSAPEPAPAPMTKEEFDKRSRENADLMAQAIKDNNPEQMKKALAAQQELVKQKAAAQAGGPQQGGEPGWFKYFLMLVASGLFIIAAMWVVFKKAGESGWKSLVPIYNMYVLMQISGKPGWWSFVMLVPVVGFAIYLLAMLSLAEKFGRSAAYGVGLFLLPMFFFPMLAFGGAKYEEAMPLELEFTFSEEPLHGLKKESLP